MRNPIHVILLVLSLWNPVSWASEPQDALRDQLKQLVEINSGSVNTAGVDRIQSWVSQQLKQMGFTVDLGANRLLIGTLQGHDPKIITILVHADTVFEPTSPFQHFTVNSDGKMATGPGVIDDKGGIVVALDGLRRYLNSHQTHYTLRFVSSPSEETGSPGLVGSFRTLAKDAWLVLGFEPALEDGSIVQIRRGDRWYHITVTGKEAHSGRAHKDGINACNDLAAKIVKISALTDYQKDLTVSVGHMLGGQDKYNIVCGKAEAKVDTRFATVMDRDELHKKIEKILQSSDVPGSKIEFKLEDDSAPVSPSKESAPFIKQYLASIEQVEGTPTLAGKSGGAADSNSFSRQGVIIIDGLGPIGKGMHTVGESILLPSLDSRAEALSRFLAILK